MQRCLIMTVSVATVVILGCAAAEEGLKSGGLKSGPQAGESILGVFHPLNVTGESAGQRVCQI